MAVWCLAAGWDYTMTFSLAYSTEIIIKLFKWMHCCKISTPLEFITLISLLTDPVGEISALNKNCNRNIANF